MCVYLQLSVHMPVSLCVYVHVCVCIVYDNLRVLLIYVCSLCMYICLYAYAYQWWIQKFLKGVSTGSRSQMQGSGGAAE